MPPAGRLVRESEDRLETVGEGVGRPDGDDLDDLLDRTELRL
jgi:hypothetical protein